MVNEWQSDPRGEVIGSEYVVLPDTDPDARPRFTPERVRPAPRVLSEDEKRVLRRNRDMFFGSDRPDTGQIAAYRNPNDNWEWDVEHHRWVNG